MKASAIIPIFPVLLLLGACQGSYDYEEHKEDFPNKVWEQGQVLNFNPELDSGGSYRVLLDFRHVYGFATPELKIRTTIKSPSGKSESADHKVRVLKDGEKGEEPQYLSDCSGDICDRTAVLFEEKSFSESGKYKIRIQQRNREQLPNVMGVGLMLKRNMSGEDVVIQKDAVQGR